MSHDQQQKVAPSDKSGKEQKDMPKKGAGPDVQKGQNNQPKKDEGNRHEQNR